ESKLSRYPSYPSPKMTNPVLCQFNDSILVYSAFGYTNYLANQAAHTMSASARQFHNEALDINLNRNGNSTEADIVWL
ncbi:hypothetical protein, partial [Pelagicoccus sp. SDUM812002]|uniref:hypothetical protein n=1 Tax=Pelagicoccus sp. SDUM812002 TaxID=3041266 RepID=UPI00280D6C7C